MDKDYILELENITKIFPGVKALDEVSFNVERNTIHGLVGENGAGKSTLINVLAGIYTDYEGIFKINGEKIDFSDPREAQLKGISVVHQEIELAGTLSVTENIFLGNLLFTKGNLVDWKSMRRKAQEMVNNLGMDIDVDTPVSSLPVAKKQIVEICKAINLDTEIIIMDEPSAALTENELETLFKIIDELKQGGITIIYISHRLEAIFDIADNVSVLRDGQHIGTLPVSDVDREKLIHMMVGRELGNEFPKEFAEIGDVVMEVKGLTREGVFHDVSFELHKSEVLGIAGLIGSGRTELARGILGIDKVDSGKIILKGKEVHHNSFGDAIDNSMGLIPEDRKKYGIIREFPVKENICLVSINQVIENGIVRNKLEKKYAREYVDKLDISTPSVETEVKYLSGGNQQKVVVAKWLMQDSEILILDEPTRGIDVGAKTEIYKLINSLVKSGKSVIMISSELPEILGMSDRILVMHRGEIVGMLNREEASQEKILRLCV